MDGDWSSFGVSQAPDVCSVSGEYFRAQTLTCESCPSGEAVTADGLGCECVGNTIRTSVDPAGTLPSSPYGVCMSCATESKVASWDRTTCMACDATAGATFDADQDDCVCGDPATQIVVELDAAGVRVTQPMRSPTYDCVNSLLLNESGAFRDAFNAQLSAMLSEVAHEREVGSNVERRNG